MAYRETVKNSELKEYLRGSDFFWNITAGVGINSPNYWADVMLVQYLINEVCHGEVVLVCDGSFGPKTAKAIRTVQRAFGNLLNCDGKLNTIDGTKLRSTISKTVYTVVALNEQLKVYSPSKFADITADINLPAALRSELSKIVYDVAAA